MKRFPSFPIILLGALGISVLSFPSCSEKNEFEYHDEAASGQMVFNAIDQNGNVSAIAQGTSVGVYVVGEDGNVTLHGLAVDGDGRVVVPTSSRSDSIVAYIPFQEGWGVDAFFSYPLFSVLTDQSIQEQYDASDLMIGSCGPSTGEKVDSITFRHVLSKVAIHVIDETGHLALDQISVKLLNVNHRVEVDLPQQRVMTIDKERSDILMLSKVTTDWRISSYAIVAPQDISDGTLFFTVMLNDMEFTYPIPQATTLQSGKTYTINLRLKFYGLVPDGWYITDWDEVNETNIDVQL